jgi:hypothetical protein
MTSLGVGDVASHNAHPSIDIGIKERDLVISINFVVSPR